MFPSAANIIITVEILSCNESLILITGYISKTMSRLAKVCADITAKVDVASVVAPRETINYIT